MAPTKKSAAAKPKAAAGSHASYLDMIKMAIVNLKDRKGSSRQAIKKYIKANNNLGATTEAAFNSHINRALATGDETGVFERPKGPSGPVKLKKPATAAKPAPAKPAAKPAAKSASKPAAKPAPKKPAAPKTKKPAEKKPKAVKKVAPKAKVGTAAPKAAAPAVDNKPAVVTGKTKSGRVTKSKAPQSSVKKTATKKTATGKKPTKKAEAKKE